MGNKGVGKTTFIENCVVSLSMKCVFLKFTASNLSLYQNPITYGKFPKNITFLDATPDFNLESLTLHW